MKIFLDDERSPPNKTWTLLKSAKEVIEQLKTFDVTKVTHLSLDHDLGDERVYGTGYDVLLWIEEQVITSNYHPPSFITIHTANPAAQQKMMQSLKKIVSVCLERDVQVCGNVIRRGL